MSNTPIVHPVGVDWVRERLRTYRPVITDDAGAAHAAVALVLRDGDHGAEFVVIHRAHRHGDPWSGHMALPGGRRSANDADLRTTAIRETREEVGVDLLRYGEPFGLLDDLRAIGRGRPLDLIITPFVFGVTAPVSLTPDAREVQSAFWVPLSSLRRHDSGTSAEATSPAPSFGYPAFVYQGHTIWGLTHRILTGLLDIIIPPARPTQRGQADNAAR